jgi:hypothetical protein
LLKDEQVQTVVRAHLASVPIGEVTPKQFHKALNDDILPLLGLVVKGGLLEHMAWRWLLALGWRCTRVKKGVYMDGHERPDVIKYRDDVFLPLMASYERCMVQWKPEGAGLVRIESDLGPDEKRVIAVFQDESCFHVNNNKQMTWCVPSSQFPQDIIFTLLDRNQDGRQKIVKKGCGRLIYISDFIKEKNGCLIICDQEGIVQKDA